MTTYYNVNEYRNTPVNFTAADLVSATVKVLQGYVATAFHTDKYGSNTPTDLTDQLNKAFTLYRKANKEVIQETLIKFLNNTLFEKAFNALTEVQSLKENGHDKTYARGFLMMNGVTGKQATEILNQVFGQQRAGATSKQEIVAFIISNEHIKKSTLISILANKFNFSVSTARTIIAHHEYMKEYARQVNNH